ncbi:MAG: hypothetical protein AB7F98_02150 [Novosphingobium sp.]
MNTPTDPDQERARIQRSRNVVMALLLGFFALLVYFMTYVKMG